MVTFILVLLGLVISYVAYKMIIEKMRKDLISLSWLEFKNQMIESGQGRWIEMSVYFNYLYYLDYIGYEQYKPYFMNISVVNEYLDLDSNVSPSNLEKRVEIFKSLCEKGNINPDLFTVELINKFLDYMCNEEYWKNPYESFYHISNELWWTDEEAEDWFESYYNGSK